jgi:hypothetical protein
MQHGDAGLSQPHALHSGSDERGPVHQHRGRTTRLQPVHGQCRRDSQRLFVDLTPGLPQRGVWFPCHETARRLPSGK